MRTVALAVYEFDELSDKAKDRARQWWRECSAGDNDWADYVLEDADRMAGIMGIAIDRRRVPLHGGSTREDPCIWWSVGYCQSDGAWIEARYWSARGAHRKIREEAPEDTTLHDLADRLQALQKPYQYRLTARIKDDERRPMQLDVDHDTREVDNETYKALGEVIRDFQRWIYKQLRAAHEWEDADEQIDETIRANEYTFTADGNRFEAI